MGYMRHHAIVVTSDDEEIMELARQKAIELKCAVSGIVWAGQRMNNVLSFLIAPDGSKEGWLPSALGNQQRDAFIDWVRSTARGRLDWVEVQFADEYGENLVTRDSSRVGLMRRRLQGINAEGSR